MEALIPILAVISVGVLAMRFGHDSRSGYTYHGSDYFDSTNEVQDSSLSMTSSSTAAIQEPLLAAPDGIVIKQLVWAQTLAAQRTGAPLPYPTLAAIDTARGAGQPAFATDPDAELLEQMARDLSNRYWSELVWLTGMIDGGRFNMVCAELERARSVPNAAVQVIVVPEASLRVAS